METPTSKLVLQHITGKKRRQIQERRMHQPDVDDTADLGVSKVARCRLSSHVVNRLKRFIRSTLALDVKKYINVL